MLPVSHRFRFNTIKLGINITDFFPLKSNIGSFPGMEVTISFEMITTTEGSILTGFS